MYIICTQKIFLKKCLTRWFQCVIVGLSKEMEGFNMEMNNILFETFLSMLDAKTRISIWKSTTDKVFEGKVYELYNNAEYSNMYISCLYCNAFSGISVLLK